MYCTVVVANRVLDAKGVDVKTYIHSPKSLSY